MYEDEYEEEASRERDARDLYYIRMREAAAIRAAHASFQHVRYQITITMDVG